MKLQKQPLLKLHLSQNMNHVLKDMKQRLKIRKTKKGDYPFQVFNPHYFKRRFHSTFDNVAQLREAMPNPVYINANDAEEIGIKDGETVLLSNQYGKVSRPAKVVETIMPGTVALPRRMG